MKTKIYLASPYTHENPQVEHERFEAVCKAAGQLMNKGFLVFSPIAHRHPIAMQNNLPRDIDFWMEFDRSFLEWADELVVLKIDGWNSSIGVKLERDIAFKKKMPIKLHCPKYNIFTHERGISGVSWVSTA